MVTTALPGGCSRSRTLAASPSIRVADIGVTPAPSEPWIGRRRLFRFSNATVPVRPVSGGSTRVTCATHSGPRQPPGGVPKTRGSRSHTARVPVPRSGRKACSPGVTWREPRSRAAPRPDARCRSAPSSLRGHRRRAVAAAPRPAEPIRGKPRRPPAPQAGQRQDWDRLSSHRPAPVHAPPAARFMPSVITPTRSHAHAPWPRR